MILGVIPARWGSTRFPGKILHPLCGRPMLAWVVDRARRARRLDAVLVATEDERIAAVAAACGVEAVMTSPDHPSGTDRVAEAARGRGAEAVVNIQGDEPLVDPALLDRLAEAVTGPAARDMATAAAPIGRADWIARPSVVKVVCSAAGDALYFSRAVIPHVRDAAPGAPLPPHAYLRHIGVYAYRTEFLGRLVAEPPCALERWEGLEQLRALHLGARIRVLVTEDRSLGVDTPGDVAAAEAALRAEGPA
jgi:3-deoxy-manno-octulosonate cytidylyltransferase (CMP-KDO synthetase)